MARTEEAIEHFQKISHYRVMPPSAIADWAASAGFGSTAAVTFTGEPNDMRGMITVTCGGTGQGANPTLTWTFNKQWEAAPTIVCNRSGATQPTIPFTITTSTTGAVFTFRGTASGSEVYSFFYMVVG